MSEKNHIYAKIGKIRQKSLVKCAWFSFPREILLGFVQQSESFHSKRKQYRISLALIVVNYFPFISLRTTCWKFVLIASLVSSFRRKILRDTLPTILSHALLVWNIKKNINKVFYTPSLTQERQWKWRQLPFPFKSYLCTYAFPLICWSPPPASIEYI